MEETFKEIYDELSKIALENGYNLTDNAKKISEFRVKAKIPMEICPCDKKNPGRGCIGPVCRKEIEEKGVCTCKCFTK